MILTPLCYGHPPQDEGGIGEPYNVWPYICVCGLLMFVVWVGLIYHINSKS